MDDMSLLITAVLGSILAIISLTFISALIVRKKKAQIKYDLQKIEENYGESEKLKREAWSANMLKDLT